jgi:hypothetical protein
LGADHDAAPAAGAEQLFLPLDARLAEADRETGIAILSAVPDVIAFLLQNSQCAIRFSLQHNFYIANGNAIAYYLNKCCYHLTFNLGEMLASEEGIIPETWDAYHMFTRRLITTGEPATLEYEIYSVLIPDQFKFLFNHIPAAHNRENIANDMINDIKLCFNKIPMAEQKNLNHVIEAIYTIGLAAGGPAKINARDFLTAIQIQVAQNEDFAGSPLAARFAECIHDLTLADE